MARTILVYENPKYVPRGVVTIGLGSGQIETVQTGDLQRRLDAAPKPGKNAKLPTSDDLLRGKP